MSKVSPDGRAWQDLRDRLVRWAIQDRSAPPAPPVHPVRLGPLVRRVPAVRKVKPVRKGHPVLPVRLGPRVIRDRPGRRGRWDPPVR